MGYKLLRILYFKYC